MFKQIKLLIWKSFLIRKLYWKLSLLEIIIPTLLFSLIFYGKSNIDDFKRIEINETFYEDRDLETIEQYFSVGEMHIWYCPYTKFTDSIIQNVQERFQIINNNIKYFISEEELLKHLYKNLSNSVAVIIFRERDNKSLDYDISIYDNHIIWETDKLFTPIIKDDDDSVYKYLYEGFITLQTAINIAFLEMWNQDKFVFYIQQFPDPPHISNNKFFEIFIELLPLVTMLSFSSIYPAILKCMSEEKYSGAKELLKIVNVGPLLQSLGWIIHSLLTNLISIIVIVIILKFLIELTSSIVLFILLLLYYISSISFCFLISSILSKPNMAIVFGLLIWILSYLIPQIPNFNQAPFYVKLVLTVFPNISLRYAYSSIAIYEIRNIGSHLNNIFEPALEDINDISIGIIYICLIFDILLFMILSIYIENVNPGKYGISQPFHFPFLIIKNYIQKKFSNIKYDNIRQNNERVCIEIKNLYKKYSTKYAIENLNIDIYKDNITVILGQNGAGKTTIMSILSGIIDATEGEILINGNNLKTHGNSIRSKMGICLQHNLLFPYLTTSQHLELFAMLRGKSYKDAKKDASNLLKKLNIDENKMINMLSGGMKRKLCLGIAIIGDTDILIIDEPSAGVDIESRLKIWELLREYKKKKTIILTTHLMEEVDALADNVIIIGNGQLLDNGTLNGLKNKYKTGYELILTFNQLSGDIINEVTTIIGSSVTEQNNNLICWISMDNKNSYAGLFKILEDKKNELGILSMHVREVTIENVYLKAIENQTNETAVDIEDIYFTAPKSTPSVFYIILALIIKRWFFLKRKFYWYIPSIIIYGILSFVIVWLSIGNNIRTDINDHKLILDLSIYGKTKVLYNSDAPTELSQIFTNLIEQSNGKSIAVRDINNGLVNEGVYYKKHIIVAVEFNYDYTNNITSITALYSRNAIHSLPISVNLAFNCFIKSVLDKNFSITVSNNPLQIRNKNYLSELSSFDIQILWLILVPIAAFFLMSAHLIFPIFEIYSKFITIQLNAGVKIWQYWLTNIIFDYILTCILKFSTLLIVILLINILFGDINIMGYDELTTLSIIFLCYIWESSPFIYLLSIKNTISNGLKLLFCSVIFLGIIPTSIVIALESSKNDIYIDISKYIRYTFLSISPQFSITYICIKFAEKYVENTNWRYMISNKKKYICETNPNPCCIRENSEECYNYKNYMNYETKINIYVMLISFLLYGSLLYIFHSRIIIKLCKRFHNNKSKCETNLQINNLRKSFGKKEIVKGFNLQLKKGECFGLLGINGAGKTTTLNIIAKTLDFDKGQVVLYPDINIQDSLYERNIGYCPQDNCLNYGLSGNEILFTFSLMRGFTIKESNNISQQLLNQVGLTKHKNKESGRYSGGNKRKLCYALAFLGCPRIIILDEPTSGVDPVSRRYFWNLVRKIKEYGVSIILSSHSMEECERICDIVGITKNGTIHTQGTPLELRKQFKGHLIKINRDNINSLDSNIINNCEILEENNSNILISINETVPLSILFKQECIYSITQNTLENVFKSVINQ